MQTQKTETPRLGPRIQSWIDAIVPGTPEATERNNTRKRPRQQQDNNPRPTKRTTRRALATATGNIMAPPTQPPNRPPIESPRRSGRIEAKTPQKSTNRGSQANDEVQEEDTPRPGRSRQDGTRTLGGQGTIPVLAPSTASHGLNARNNSQSSPSRTSKSSNDRTQSLDEESVGGLSLDTSSSRRSQSPTKMADLFTAERSTELAKLTGSSAEKAGGFLDNYAALRVIGQGDGVIPISLRKNVENFVHEADKPPKRCYTTVINPNYDNTIWAEVVAIYEQAGQCETEGFNEGGWNDNVHGPLLKLVSENPKYLGAISHYNVTSARISPEDLYMKNVNGATMGGKKVDYVLGLKPDEGLKKRIKQTLALHPQKSQSLNQTPYPAIRTVIVFLSTETKPPTTGGQQANVQLATWGYSGFVKLHQMLAKNGHGDEPLPPMPMLSAHGHEWHLSALHEDGADNKLLGKVLFGTTETIQGIFQIIKALDLLIDWGNTEYRDWYLSKVLIAA